MLLSHPLLHFHLKPNLHPTRIRINGRLSWTGYPTRTRNLSPLRRLPPPRISPCDAASSVEDFNAELGRLLSLLPGEMRLRASEHPELRDLIEVVMDLGRKPLARFPSGDFVLSDFPLTTDDIQHATSKVGDFADDNRAGISRTLHRISAIRNRKGEIIGLTCRVGRVVPGSANLLRDLIKDGASLLLIGPPGVGKTTIIRDIARMLANEYGKRVMVVDTSNEIGGDGDIPHAGIGNARRMQVPHTDVQHKVLIEAVENHMPQVIVIDEIGTKLEAAAASTIAQRGIQLVATAHGVTIENLVMNPALDMLIGGVQSVTLGDEEANRRGVQKTVLERKGPSTFTSGVELISKIELRIHRSLEATVDALLTGRNPKFEVRRINQGSKYEFQPRIVRNPPATIRESGIIEDTYEMNEGSSLHAKAISEEGSSLHAKAISEEASYKDEDVLSIFLYGIAEASVIQGMKQSKLDDKIVFTDNISEADVLLALQPKLKKNSRLQAAVRSRGIPSYVSKTSSLSQTTKTIRALVSDFEDGFMFPESESKSNDSERIDALEEARIAIEGTVILKGEMVELLPRRPNILLLQKDLIRKYNLKSERVYSEFGERLRVLPLQSEVEESSPTDSDDDGDFENLWEVNGDMSGSASVADRLPILPD